MFLLVSYKKLVSICMLTILYLFSTTAICAFIVAVQQFPSGHDIVENKSVLVRILIDEWNPDFEAFVRYTTNDWSTSEIAKQESSNKDTKEYIVNLKPIKALSNVQYTACLREKKTGKELCDSNGGSNYRFFVKSELSPLHRLEQFPSRQIIFEGETVFLRIYVNNVKNFKKVAVKIAAKTARNNEIKEIKDYKVDDQKNFFLIDLGKFPKGSEVSYDASLIDNHGHEAKGSNNFKVSKTNFNETNTAFPLIVYGALGLNLNNTRSKLYGGFFPNAPTIHDYNPTLAPYLLNVQLPNYAYDLLPGNLRAVLQKYNLHAFEVEVFAQTIPVEFLLNDKKYTNLRPHYWIDPTMPQKFKGARENRFIEASIFVDPQNIDQLPNINYLQGNQTNLDPIRVYIHDGKASPDNGRILLKKKDKENYIWSIVFDWSNRKAAITLHWLLDNKQQDKMVELLKSKPRNLNILLNNLAAENHFKESKGLKHLRVLLGL